METFHCCSRFCPSSPAAPKAGRLCGGNSPRREIYCTYRGGVGGGGVSFRAPYQTLQTTLRSKTRDTDSHLASHQDTLGPTDGWEKRLLHLFVWCVCSPWCLCTSCVSGARRRDVLIARVTATTHPNPSPDPISDIIYMIHWCVNQVRMRVSPWCVQVPEVKEKELYLFMFRPQQEVHRHIGSELRHAGKSLTSDCWIKRDTEDSRTSSAEPPHGV